MQVLALSVFVVATAAVGTSWALDECAAQDEISMMQIGRTLLNRRSELPPGEVAKINARPGLYWDHVLFPNATPSWDPKKGPLAPWPDLWPDPQANQGVKVLFKKRMEWLKKKADAANVTLQDSIHTEMLKQAAWNRSHACDALEREQLHDADTLDLGNLSEDEQKALAKMNLMCQAETRIKQEGPVKMSEAYLEHSVGAHALDHMPASAQTVHGMEDIMAEVKGNEKKILAEAAKNTGQPAGHWEAGHWVAGPADVATTEGALKELATETAIMAAGRQFLPEMTEAAKKVAADAIASQKAAEVAKDANADMRDGKTWPSSIWPGWSARNLLWNDWQCPNLGIHVAEVLQRCKTLCQETEQCNAVNYNAANHDCILRDCPRPIPTPIWSVPGYLGYADQAPDKNLPIDPGLASEFDAWANSTMSGPDKYNVPKMLGMAFNFLPEELENTPYGVDYIAYKLNVSRDDVTDYMTKLNEHILGSAVVVTPAPLYETVQMETVKSLGPFQCHQYASGENNAWCQQRDSQIHDGYEFLYMDDQTSELQPCNGCWCCKRQVMEETKPVVTYNTKLIDQSFVSAGMFGEMQCHIYAAEQDDYWCQSRGDQVYEGWQYTFVVREQIVGNQCGGCSCCKRELQQVGR